MSDYISRDAALEALDELERTSRHNSVLWPDHVEECREALRGVPAANVVTVVRCKDCMYYQKDELGRWCFNDYENELRDDDFCSHGKRKESKT